MEYMILITNVNTKEEFCYGKFDLNQAIDYCKAGQEETGEEYTHEIYTIH